MESQLLIKIEMVKNRLLAFKLSDVVFIMLINVKMSTIVGILTFLSMTNFIFSWVEHEKKLFNLLAFKLSDVVFIMLINGKMPTIVGILTFMSMVKFHAQLS